MNRRSSRHNHANGRWDTQTLVEKMELQFGRNLQYIRINGTLVGGLVGLIIFAVSKLFG